MTNTLPSISRIRQSTLTVLRRLPAGGDTGRVLATLAGGAVSTELLHSNQALAVSIAVQRLLLASARGRRP